jgi:hypothetical protein
VKTTEGKPWWRDGHIAAHMDDPEPNARDIVWRPDCAACEPMMRRLLFVSDRAREVFEGWLEFASMPWPPVRGIAYCPTWPKRFTIKVVPTPECACHCDPRMTTYEVAAGLGEGGWTAASFFSGMTECEFKHWHWTPMWHVDYTSDEGLPVRRSYPFPIADEAMRSR